MSVGSRPSKNGHSDIKNTSLRNVMQNHTNVCTAFIVYKMLSRIPAHLFLLPFLLSIKKYIYTPDTMFDTRDAKKMNQDIQVSTLEEFSLMKSNSK